MDNYYQLLRVPEDADYHVIDEAYWRLARESSARSGGTPYTIEDLNEAYELLRTPILRQGYDASRARQLETEGADSDPASEAGVTPAPIVKRADVSTSAFATEERFVDTLQLQVRQVRERMRARNATIEAPVDQHTQSPLLRMFDSVR